MTLNAPQLAAASHRDGPLLVFAGAGSGKTRVITQRIVNLVKGGTDPSRVCAVTFTNKAAGEMRERLAGMLGYEPAKRLTVSTFHALCVQLLRQEPILNWAGRRRGFVIYDERDAESLLASVCENELGSDEDDSDAPSSAEARKRLKKFLEEVNQFIEERRQLLEDPGTYRAVGPDEARLARVWAAYEDAKRGANAFDFADLIVYGVRLVESPCELGEYARSLYEYLLVDEFQDTDGLQLRLVKGLASNGNLCVVGDDDQCIYAWRGARIENIRGFRDHYPNVTVVKLEQNYRSTSNVVRAAVGVIEPAEVREPKRMFTEAPGGDPVRVIECLNATQEAEVIRTQVQSLLAEGVDASSIAVLYRNHATARQIEHELRKVEIPHKTHGGFRWFDRSEVRDALALFKLVLNQSSTVDCLRALDAVVRGVGKGTVGKLVALATTLGVPLFQALRRRATLKLRPAQDEAIERFTSTILSLATTARSAGAATMVKRLLDETGLAARYREDAQDILKAEGKKRQLGAPASPDSLRMTDREKYDAIVEKADRLEELVTDAESFAERAMKRGDGATFADYVEAICLRADDREGEDRGVQLMTVHASKGLEFHTVFIPACEAAVFARNMDKSSLSMPGVEEDDAPESSEGTEDDDRRLFYVALTRAQKKLYLLHARQRLVRGLPQLRSPCPFILDIPEEVLETVEPEELLRQSDSDRSVNTWKKQEESRRYAY